MHVHVHVRLRVYLCLHLCLSLLRLRLSLCLSLCADVHACHSMLMCAAWDEHVSLHATKANLI